MKLNRKLVLILSLVLSVALATGGTLAYLSDTDADVNVMTLGNVYITQNEQERVGDELDAFQQNKPVYPMVNTGSSADKTAKVTVNDAEYDMWNDGMKNVVDKIVTVTNTGSADAYVRTIVAIEAPDAAIAEMININANEVGITATAWQPVTIEGVNYIYAAFTYVDALPAETTSAPSLLQLYLASEAGNKEVAAFGDNWEVLVLSQAVQTAGFETAEAALNTAFGKVDENVATWMSKTAAGSQMVVGTPGDKNDSNNPPVIMPDTSWNEGADTSWFNDGESSFTIDSAAELAGFAKLVNEGGKNFRGKTVTLTADVDMGDHLWIPVGQTGATQFQGTFDGGNYTISNLYIDSSAETGAHYSTGLFGWLNKATVKNVNVKNAEVIGNHNVGVIAGYMETAGCTISGCTVTKATVTGKHANDDACGDKVGVIVGHAGNAGVLVENCTVSDCTVVAGRDAGQVAGAAKTANVVDCTANKVTVTAGGDCTGNNINEAIIGRVL